MSRLEPLLAVATAIAGTATPMHQGGLGDGASGGRFGGRWTY